MADRIVVMRDGAVEQFGAAARPLRPTGKIFVARFIGSPAMNLLKGKVMVNGQPSFVTDDGFTLPLAFGAHGPDEQAPASTGFALSIWSSGARCARL